MVVLPPFQTSESGILTWRVRDYQKGHLRPRLLRGGLLHCGAGARRGHARCLTLHLAKVWRPGRVTKTGGLVFHCELEQLFERTWLGVHAGVWIADPRKALRNREHGEVSRVAMGDLMPVQWC